ncbi:hypothetical protein PRIPAC_78692 [Pristionchus pacificus]|uniref:G protein-coupled receptor n=1 Tax=Pristionchus pacificus TaxID=54126 RepID=A0A2A6CMF9_PRIPA|nr:hypothetical protein PRIPAC_78692 [Pristionchus pacificus]|eukprot:PDM79211.1 G protein-coupled receptor [Pristionchus pacificus]
MAAWAAIFPDMILSPFYILLLILLATAKDVHFKTPFFMFFIVTGVYSIMAIIFYYIAAEFTYTERHWTFLFFKPAYALNAIGAFGATIGKTNIVVHRYLVMRSRDFAETNWPRKSITRLLAVQFVFCVLLTASIWPASYIYANKEAMDRIVALSKFETMIQMAIAVATYILYIISNGIFTVLTSRELIRMKGMLENSAVASRKIMAHQRNMVIIVTICSLTHLMKMVHQLIIAVTKVVPLQTLYDAIWPMYPLFNGLAAYAAPICLVALSQTVRMRIISACTCRAKSDNFVAVFTVTKAP